MNTRNITEDEIQQYERLQRDLQGKKLELMEFEQKLQEDYEIPAEAGINAKGVFVLGNTSLRDLKTKKIAPKHMQPGLSKEEMRRLSQLRAAVNRCNVEIEKYMYLLKSMCDAPHFAKLNSSYLWVRPDTGEPFVQPVSVEDEETSADAPDSEPTDPPDPEPNA